VDGKEEDVMAGTMVHLLVAEKLLQELAGREWRYFFQKPVEFDADYFVAGNICPDGVMAREGYQREMKLHTHFRDGIPDGSFDKPGMIPLFEQRMKAFWQQHEEDEQQCPGLYLGYVTHMMTDERFILEERPKFFENIAVIGLTQKDVETFTRFNKETDLVDFRLIREYPVLQEARKSLECVPPYEIKGMMTQQELTASRNWILQYFFQEPHTTEEAEFLDYQSMVQFIEKVVKEIVQRLVDEQYIIQ
jgi:hypothetical protein